MFDQASLEKTIALRLTVRGKITLLRTVIRGGLALALITLAYGCAASTVWVKPAATSYDFESDKSACLAQLQGAYAGVDPLELALMGGDMLANCMRGKGWRQQAANVQTPSAPPSSQPKCESANSILTACDSPTATTMRLGGRAYRRTSSGWEPTDEGKVGASSPAQPATGCSKDTDCKGDRVCESGRCIAPH